jgi:GT2 family glycosyltransferase
MPRRSASANDRPSVAVVIPSWNTREYLGPCIAAVHDEADVVVELVVVDNGSVDGSVEFLEHSHTEHVALPQNLGFAKAVNLGVERTTAPLVLVLNADVVLAAGCLRTLAVAISDDASLGGVQPKIIAGDGLAAPVTIYSAGQGLTIGGSAFEVGKGQPDGPPYSKPQEIFGVCGAVCLLRRELFAQLGGYDERFFAFYEDVDLNARARLAGWRFSYVPGAVAYHVGHAAWRKQHGARAFNVRLTVQNRGLTAIKVLPARCLPWVVLATARTLIASPFRRVGRAALAGTGGMLRWMPQALHERRRLRASAVCGVDAWLSRRRIDPLGPR